MGFVTNEIPESLTEYNAYRASPTRPRSPPTCGPTTCGGRRTCPYIDVPEPAIKKNIYYRWWLMRFNNLDADIPGQTFQFPISIEGVLGYNNAIVLTQPMHIDDLKYLRNPIYALRRLAVGRAGLQERPVPRQPRRPGELVQQLHPVHRRGGLEELPDPRRTAGHRAATSPGTPRGRQGPARLLRHQQQRAHRVRLGRADRQRRRRGVVPLAGGPAGPGRVGLPVQRRAARPRRPTRRSATPPRPTR